MNDYKTYDHDTDNLLDGITVDDILLVLNCNVRKEEITPERVAQEIDALVKSRMQDLRDLRDNWKAQICKEALKGRE